MKKVLVLEDESSIRSFVVINLKRSGYEPIEAETGEQALELVRQNPDVKVALLDVFYKDNALPRKAALERLQASKRVNGGNFTQVGLSAMPGNRDASQEQLYRRIRGWLSPQPVDK